MSGANKKCKNPIFRAVLNYITDDFWTDLFIQCSNGKFPRGVKYVNGTLSYRKGKISVAKEIPVDPKTAAEAIVELFEQIGLKSNKHDEKNQMKLELALQAYKIVDWSSAKKESVRNALFSNFAIKMAMRYGLDSKKITTLYHTLRIGLFIGILRHDDIIMDNGQITDINGLVYVPSRGLFCLAGSISEIKFPTGKIPVDFVPVPQVDYTKTYDDLVGFYLRKRRKKTT